MNLSKINVDGWYQTKSGVGKCLTNSGRNLKFEIDGEEVYLPPRDVQHEIAKGEEPQEEESDPPDAPYFPAMEAHNGEGQPDATLTAADMRQAALHLAKSSKGLDAMEAILNWLDHTGLGLDQTSQEAILTLLEGAWGQFAGTARDEMREALEKG